MYLMYVDESGDVGLNKSPTRYFVLTGLVIHESHWLDYLNRLVDFRRQLRDKYGLKLREEIHASAFINSPRDLIRIKRHERLAILRELVDHLAGWPHLDIINVVVDKTKQADGSDVFDRAWTALLQRFENTINANNFRYKVNAQSGFVIPDATDNKKLITLLRKMRRFNPVPNQTIYSTGYRNLPLTLIVEDPFIQRSGDSFFIQAADVCAHLLYQHLEPNNYMRRKSGQNYFLRLQPVLCIAASPKDPLGIVRL